MKRFARLLLLLVLACTDNPTAPTDATIPTATLKRAAGCALGAGTYVRALNHYVGTRWQTDMLITFHTTQCASDVNVKVYLIYPGEPLGEGFLDGERKPIGAADAPEIDDDFLPGIGTPHQARLRWPKEPAYPEHWDAKFWVEVRAGGTLIGGFRTVDDGSPDF